MSKLLSYKYTGTKGHIADVASSLPKNPDDLLSNGWTELQIPEQKLPVTHVFSRKKALGFEFVLIRE